MQKLLLEFNTKKAAIWGLLFSLIFIPLYMKFPLLSISGTFVSVRLDDIVIFICFVSWLVYITSKRKLGEFTRSDLFYVLFAFFAIGVFSTISGVILTKTIKLNLGILHLARRFEFMVFMPVAYTLAKSSKLRKKIVSILFLVALLVNFYAIGQKWLSFPAVSTTNAELSKGKVYFLGVGDRISSTFAGHYDLAVFLMIVVCLAIPLSVYLWKSHEYKSFAFCIFVSVLSFAMLVLTAARFSFLAVFLGVFISFLLIGNKKLLILLAVAFGLIFVYPSALRDRIIATVRVNILQSFSSFTSTNSLQESRGKLNIPTLPIADENQIPKDQNIPDIAPGEPTDTVDLGVYRSLAIRTNIEWPRALRAFYKNPFFGTGYSSLGLATDNDYLRALGETGFLGILSFFMVLYFVFKKLWRAYRRTVGFSKYLLAGIISMYLAFLSNAVFIDVFEASKTATIFWIVVGVGLAVAQGSNKK